MTKTKKTKREKTDDPKKKLRARVARAPQKPGIYKWLSKSGEILYIGKAKNLKNRLKSYVQKKPDLSLGPWKLALVKNIADIDYTVTDTELEALILETNLIKGHKPKYNVMMKDDKNYVYVRITVRDDYPEVSIERRMEQDKARPNGRSSGRAKYFGPFTSARDTRRTLELLHDVFGFRACKRSIQVLSKDPMAETKPCIDHQIGKCNGLCAGRLTQDEYKRRTEEVIRFFKGEHGNVIEKLKEMLQEAAATKKFEKAARLRDTLAYIESLKEQQIVSDTSRANADFIGTALQRDRAHIVILREREGKLIAELSYALKGKADTEGEVLAQFLPQYYSEMTDLPDTVICGEDFEEKDVLEEWLCEKRGKKVTIDVPERGKKSKLLKMAEENAKEKIQQQLAKWEAEAQKIESALKELKEKLGLKDIPKRIECYDISHYSGTETVGSMVVFVNGKAKNEHYRSFTIRTMQEGEIDDYKALKEVLQRRLRHLKVGNKQWWKKEDIALEKKDKLYFILKASEESIFAEHKCQFVRRIPKELQKKVKKGKIVMMFDRKKNKPDASFVSQPDLLVLDGGKGQLSVGVKVLKTMKLGIPVIALAKKEETVFSPGRPSGAPLRANSEGLFLLMRLRDEAHRFANRHRERRAKHALTSS